MTRDPFLEKLGAAVRDDNRESAHDARWQRLAEGTLSPDERQALEREAEADPDVRELLALYAPLGEAQLARFEEAARDAHGHERDAASAAPSRAVGAARRAWGARIALLGGSLAAAAALLLWLRMPPPLPVAAYDVVVASADVGARAEGARPAPGPVVQTGTTFELVARPAVAERGPLAARAFLERDGVVTSWDAPIELSSEGVVRITGDTEALFGARRGAVTILLAVGRPGAIPTSPADLTRSADPAGERAPVRLLRTELVVGRR